MCITFLLGMYESYKLDISGAERAIDYLIIDYLRS